VSQYLSFREEPEGQNNGSTRSVGAGAGAANAEWQQGPSLSYEGIGSWGLGYRTLCRVRICVGELASNIVEHGRVRPDAGEIMLELRLKKPGLEIEISDPGVAFDPVAAPPTEIDREGVGGRGLRLVRAYAAALS
jgi:anti-sigma regulatory factor (Ser/Thr protein kinase)